MSVCRCIALMARLATRRQQMSGQLVARGRGTQVDNRVANNRRSVAERELDSRGLGHEAKQAAVLTPSTAGMCCRLPEGFRKSS